MSIVNTGKCSVLVQNFVRHRSPHKSSVILSAESESQTELAEEGRMQMQTRGIIVVDGLNFQKQARRLSTNLEIHVT